VQRAVALVWQSSPKWTSTHILLTVMRSLLPFGLIYVVKLIVDNIALSLSSADKTQTFSQILILLGVAGVLMILNNLVVVLAELASSTLAERVTDHLQVVLYRKAIEIDLESYEDPQYQDTLERAKWEAPHRPTRMLNNITQAGQSAISLIAIAGLLISLHWVLVVIVCLTSIPPMLVRIQQSKTLYTFRRHQTEVERKANYYGHLLLGDHSAKEIRLFNLGHLFIDRFTQLRQDVFRQKLSITQRQSMGRLFSQSAAMLVVLGTYGWIISQTIHGKFQLGDLVLYSQIFQRGQTALSEMISSLAGLHENNLFLTDLFEFLALKSGLVEPQHPQPFPRPMQQGISFENVSFRYKNSPRQAIQNLNLTIAPGEIVALVGENGSGKTTLVKLLCRLYDVTAGQITVDGINLRQFAAADIHKQIGVVFQNFICYQLSVAENIWLGNVEHPPSMERITLAAHQAGADEVVEHLPQGYDTLLGKWFKGGEELSWGQWQKIAVARAFLRDAQLVILDEPTSAMDAKAEADMFLRFRELIQNRSALLITHRLSSVKMADRIYVMESGQIIETGTHEQLMTLHGAYAHLFETQARNYR
jgi:ATP-binding cassette subfamily B protein